jgi:MtrB/PioB family decaheme-associated outer membrane protein
LKVTTILFTVTLAIFGTAAATFAQEPSASSSEPELQRGVAEFGFRTFWGEVYGRPDLPFQPRLKTSKLNEYTDIRNNVYLRDADILFDNLLGSLKYARYQTQSSLYRNQSHLGTFGEYGRFKAQFRYDEIPHLFTNTAGTLYWESAPGVYVMPLSLRQMLQTASSTGTASQINNSLPSFVATQVVPGATLIVPRLKRKLGTGLFHYDLSENWNVGFAFAREHEKGTRPIGAILNSSPSAAGSSQPGTTANRQSPGTGVELPEPIDYFHNMVRASTEYARRKWALQLGYNGSFFKSDIDSLRFDAPFATTDLPVQIIPPGSGCTPTASAVNCAISSVPAHGQMSTYPDNHANYLNLAGAFNAGKYVHVMGSANNGWLRQNEAFLPYTANTAITDLAPLPATSLNGEKRTLAMNWTAVSKVFSNIQLEAKYRHYDYNNHTAVFDLTPIEGDVIGANSTATGQAIPSVEDTQGRSNPGFNRKTLELSGNYLFAKHSSAKAGWESDWFDRSHRDVDHSLENTFFATVDLSPTRDLLLRIAGRHQNRKPAEYQDEAATDPTTGAPIPCGSTSAVFTEEQRCHRRFDEAARILDRGDVLLQYDVGQFSFGGTFQTIQSDYNRRGGVNSATPLNFISGITRPYYLYGALNDLSWIYSFDTTYTLSPAMSTFIEYSYERYYKRMISRNRTPTSGTATILTCNGCDSPNNDWESTTRDLFHTYAAGVDLFVGKRFWISPYYSLAAGKGNVFTRALGDPTINSGPNQFVLTGTSTPEDYPETTTRIHEFAAVFKMKLRENLMPKFEYRFQQFDNRDYQTSPMTTYMGCIGAGAIVVSPPCVNVGASLAQKFPSPYYPGFVVGDTAAARYLFLGADQPSYRTHIITATLEYRF